MPEYHYDPYHYRLHKMKGGTFSNFNDKHFVQLTDEQIQKHLRGEQVIGLYPLLPDNTSWFIAADFDKKGWINDCQNFIAHCNQLKIPVYLERSRSGNGGHIWMFFEQPYPAFKSRSILKSLLEASGVFSIFEKTSSFDRLFPNQDFHSGKGMGNLIALPLNKLSLDQNNSCFIDPLTTIPFENQWEQLGKIAKVSTKILDQLYNLLKTNQERTFPNINESLILTLNNSLYINKSGLAPPLINFIKKEFNLYNNEYFVKKKANRNTWNTKRYFNLIEEIDDKIILPRGAIGTLVRFCLRNNIKFEFKDQRTKGHPIKFIDDLHLLKHQHLAVEASE